MCSFTLDSSPLFGIVSDDALCLSAPPIYCLFRSSYEYSYRTVRVPNACSRAAIAVPSQVLAARSYPVLILGQVGLPGLLVLGQVRLTREGVRASPTRSRFVVALMVKGTLMVQVMV